MAVVWESLQDIRSEMAASLYNANVVRNFSDQNPKL